MITNKSMELEVGAENNFPKTGILIIKQQIAQLDFKENSRRGQLFTQMMRAFSGTKQMIPLFVWKTLTVFSVFAVLFANFIGVLAGLR